VPGADFLLKSALKRIVFGKHLEEKYLKSKRGRMAAENPLSSSLFRNLDLWKGSSPVQSRGNWLRMAAHTWDDSGFEITQDYSKRAGHRRELSAQFRRKRWKQRNDRQNHHHEYHGNLNQILTVLLFDQPVESYTQPCNYVVHSCTPPFDDRPLPTPSLLVA
jgi:hypothetical protein